MYRYHVYIFCNVYILHFRFNYLHLTFSNICLYIIAAGSNEIVQPMIGSSSFLWLLALVFKRFRFPMKQKRLLKKVELLSAFSTCWFHHTLSEKEKHVNTISSMCNWLLDLLWMPNNTLLGKLRWIILRKKCV